MGNVTLGELIAHTNPRAQAAIAANRAKMQIEGAKLQLADRHHRERIETEDRRAAAAENAAMARTIREGEYSLSRTIHEGENARALEWMRGANEAAATSGGMVRDLLQSQLRQQEAWGQSYGDTVRGLILAAAQSKLEARARRETHAQALEQGEAKHRQDMERTQREHRQQMEKMAFEANARILDACLAHEIQNRRVSFDMLARITEKLLERALGLGGQIIDSAEVSRWFGEAMGQASGSGSAWQW